MRPKSPWLPKRHDVANKSLNILLTRLLTKYHAAMKKLEKEREEQFAFYGVA
ncbi:MAG: hypothetical protein ACEY3G_00460 [Arsenophonus sp.]